MFICIGGSKRGLWGRTPPPPPLIHFFSFSCNFSGQLTKNKKRFLPTPRMNEQECSPVGCVPPSRWPYLPACCAPGGGCTWSEGGVPGPGGAPGPRGVYLVPGGCTCSRGVYLPGGYLVLRGVYLVPRGSVPAGRYLPRYSPRTEWQTGVKI